MGGRDALPDGTAPTGEPEEVEGLGEGEGEGDDRQPKARVGCFVVVWAHGGSVVGGDGGIWWYGVGVLDVDVEDGLGRC